MEAVNLHLFGYERGILQSCGKRLSRWHHTLLIHTSGSQDVIANHALSRWWVLLVNGR